MEQSDRPRDDDDNGDVSYHGTDEYASDCNRLPFSEPMSHQERRGFGLGCIALLAILSLGGYGAYKWIELFLIRGH